MERIIIKIGTKVLSGEDKTLDVDFLTRLVEEVVRMRESGVQVVLVTSGAVGAGKSLLYHNDAESETVRKQVFAAVGQVKLMATYAELFAKHDYLCAQVLATKEDFRDVEHYENMRRCFEGLLLDNVVPIVNENDVVATTELLFTDNDELAGLVAKQLKADSLIIMTGTDGILDDAKQTIREVNESNVDSVAKCITPDTSTGGRGGMLSKFTVARELAKMGVTAWIVNGKKEETLVKLSTQEFAGTKFLPASNLSPYPDN